MSVAADLIGIGVPAEQASVMAVSRLHVDVTAAGTTIANAKQLTGEYNTLGTVAASTGVLLPNFPIGSTVFVKNGGANTVNVFPPTSSGTITSGTTTGSAGAAQTVATTKTAMFIRVSSTNWEYVALN